MICFLLELLLSSRTPKPRSLARNATAVGLVLLLGLSTLGQQAQAGVRPPGAAEAENGRELYLAGNYEEALARFQEALVLAPDDPKIVLALGETLFKLERYEEAKVEFARALNLSEEADLRAEALYNSGTANLAAGEPDQAVKQLRESLETQPDSPDALDNLEVALRRLQQQQQEQQQQQQQDNKDNKDEDQEKKDDQQQQDQQQDQQDQQDNKDEQQQDEQQEDQQQEDQQKEDQQQEQQEQQQQDQQQEQQEKQQQPKEDELTKEQAMQILKALDRDEEELKRSVQKRLKGGRPKSGKKW